MKKIHPDVLMYIQNVKTYFETNVEAREYFLKDSNEELFFKHMTEIAEKNYEKNGEAILNKEQFELLRKTIIALTIASPNKEDNTNNDKNVFIDFPNFGFICLN